MYYESAGMNKRVINGLIGRTKQLGVVQFGSGENEQPPWSY
jgi:hypothetical protein